MVKFPLLALLVVSLVSIIECHVRLWLPLSRSSIFRDSRFSHLNPTPNWDDDGLYCGQVPQPVVVETCGICGDAFTDPTPRQNEHGGTYGRGIIVENYTSGDIIETKLEFTTTHSGYAEFQLCDSISETEDCFQTLELVSGGTKIPVPRDGQHDVFIHSNLRLPPGISCTHCVFRLNYRAENSWGKCDNGTHNVGCGLQETFRHCSDITISPKN